MLKDANLEKKRTVKYKGVGKETKNSKKKNTKLWKIIKRLNVQT